MFFAGIVYSRIAFIPKQNEARKLNHTEVVEEDKRNKEPVNIEAKRKRLEWEEQEAKMKRECKEKGK